METIKRFSSLAALMQISSRQVVPRVEAVHSVMEEGLSLSALYFCCLCCALAYPADNFIEDGSNLYQIAQKANLGDAKPETRLSINVGG